MNKVVAIASGKGGVGKSTICCHLGKALAKRNEKTIIVETDMGLRCLDIFLNVKEIVYDLADVLANSCDLEKAIHKTSHKNLFLLPAPLSFNIKIKFKEMLNLCNMLKKNFTNIILDLKAGIEIAIEVKNIVDLFLVVVTPNSVCVRDSAFLNNFLQMDKHKEKPQIRLIINKIYKNFNKISPFKNLDEIIDETKIQLIGAIPYSKVISKTTQVGSNLKKNSKSAKIFNAISKRVCNEHTKLML